MTRLRAVLWRGFRSILARPGRAALAAFGIGLGVGAALQLLGAAAGDTDAQRPASPVRIHRQMVSHGEREAIASVWTPTMASVQRAGLRAGEGRMLADLDLRDARRVAVLGAGLRAELFGFGSGLLETIQIDGLRFTVVGVLEPQSAAPGSDLPDANRAVLLPEGVVAAHLAHLLPPAGAPAAGGGRALPSLLGAIAALSLLLGGSALASAMLATVIERAREIALRLVVGATRREVFAELLLESVLVSSFGGLAGMAGALALGPGLSAGLSGGLAVWSAPVALALAALVGAAAGLLPALRAAWIDPVRALCS